MSKEITIEDLINLSAKNQLLAFDYQKEIDYINEYFYDQLTSANNVVTFPIYTNTYGKEVIDNLGVILTDMGYKVQIERDINWAITVTLPSNKISDFVLDIFNKKMNESNGGSYKDVVEKLLTQCAENYFLEYDYATEMQKIINYFHDELLNNTDNTVIRYRQEYSSEIAHQLAILLERIGFQIHCYYDFMKGKAINTLVVSLPEKKVQSAMVKILNQNQEERDYYNIFVKDYNIPDEIKDEVITVIKRFENLINEEDSFIYFDYVACKMEISAFKYESFKEYLISKGFSLHEYARSTRIVFVNIMLREDSLKENNPFGLRERSNFLCLKK